MDLCTAPAPDDDNDNEAAGGACETKEEEATIPGACEPKDELTIPLLASPPSPKILAASAMALKSHTPTTGRRGIASFHQVLNYHGG